MSDIKHRTIHTFVWETYPWELRVTEDGNGRHIESSLTNKRAGDTHYLEADDIDALRQLLREAECRP